MSDKPKRWTWEEWLIYAEIRYVNEDAKTSGLEWMKLGFNARNDLIDHLEVENQELKRVNRLIHEFEKEDDAEIKKLEAQLRNNKKRYEKTFHHHKTRIAKSL